MSMLFFAEMAWKSALIAGAALGLAYALRSRSAADRALVLRAGIAMLLLLPLIALGLPAIEVVAFPAPESGGLSTALPPEIALAAYAASAPAPEPTIWDDPTPLVLLAYLGGLAMVGSRLLGGLGMLHRWTRTAREVTCPLWLEAFDRVRWIVPDAEKVRLLVAEEVESPLSWGWRRPVILIDPDTLDMPEDAEAILAHEAAHIARRDWPMLMLSQVAAAIFWFNPLVWLLERETIQHSEEAADCEAASRVEPTRYAETLLIWAQANPALPANSIAPSARALGRRIRAILDRSTRERPSGSAWTGIALLLCLFIAAPVAAMQLVAAPPEPPAPPRAPQSAEAAPAAPAAPAPPHAIAAPENMPQPPAPPLPPGELAQALEGLDAIGPAMEESLAALRHTLPTILANAGGAIDEAALEAAIRDAQAEIRNMPPVDRAEIQRAIRSARVHSVQVPRVPAPRVHVPRAQIERAVREARAAQHHAPGLSDEQVRRIRVQVAEAARHAPRAVAVSMGHGSAAMTQGASQMEAGARRMELEADRLMARDHREREIARARERGETLTHAQLIEVGRGLREGASEMRKGAREMRESAREMHARH